MAKPRKKYRHDPMRKYDNRWLRKADSTENLRIAAAMKENIEDAQNGADMTPLIGAVIELLEGVLIALKDWHVDQEVIDCIALGMGACLEMQANAGAWDCKAVPKLCQAVDDAIAVMNQLPMRDASRGFIRARMLANFVKPHQAARVVDVAEAA